MSYSSPYSDIEIPHHDVFTHLFGDLTEEEANSPALTELTTDDTITYGELKKLAESFAGALAARGIGKGDVVTLQIPNSINYAIALLGIVRAGATVSPLGVLMNQADVDKLLELSGAKYYVGITDIENMPQIWSGEVRTLAQGNHPAPEVEISADDVMAIPFSSGTTGLPKGVMLPHNAIVANIEQTKFMHAQSGITEPIRVLSPLPFTHIYGMTTLLLTQLSARNHVFTLPKFDLATFLEAHPKHQINFTFVAPPMVVALAKHPSVTPEAFASTEYILSGAAPLDNDLARTVEKKLDITMLQGYGMTETSPVTHVGVRGKAEPGSIGFAAPNTQFKFLELESETEVPAGEVGELTVKGPQVMLGYLNNEEATNEVMVSDGWMRTGDIGRLADNGTTYIVDRAKEVIKYKGYQVAPAELEALLLTHPDVADVGVVGVDRDGLEIPHAFVVRAEGSDISAEEIIDWVATRVTPYKKVRAVDFIEQIPKNPSGKIERRKLRDLPSQS
ncbi:acyl-CoA synthetase [Corynebacterium yudongzhengii]|uniref:Acyl-CoA synthetase n=1 Tax=Corynebacterium yudongzhengii TaxID=2080740 RepID=A0A2U1T902_9CORY|nr:AMP-binding protein [Corynebacterium yudongzhengii]AWB82450.1 acyl-CoA synthetase [Corynebacterium yudongzhengii]PWC02494.1 acyl-CoA synthetase [Corynebacterium yudongzhengii]